MTRTHLTKIFDDLVKDFPKRASGTRPLGIGYFGLVITRDDENTVSKYIKRPDNPVDLEICLRGFYRETQILGLLRKANDVGISTPVLIGEPEELYSQRFAATYTMTKIDGVSASFQMDRRRKIDFNKLYEESGALTARFHRIGHEGFPHIPNRQGYDGQNVPVVPNGLSDRTNKALEKVNSYLHEHKTAGLVHGDLGTHNFVYKNNLPVGIIDFAFTGYAENQMADFCLTYPAFLPAFIHGYERETGQNLNKNLIEATRLSFATNQLDIMYKHSNVDINWASQLVENINGALNNLTYVTGFKP